VEITLEDMRENMVKRVMALAEVITEARSSAALLTCSDTAHEIGEELVMMAVARQDQEAEGGR